VETGDVEDLDALQAEAARAHHGELDLVRLVTEVEERPRGAVRGDGLLAGREERREELLPERRHAPRDGVDPDVAPDQRPVLEAAVDGVPAEPELAELHARDHAVLLARDVRDAFAHRRA
jgi:hypothetical protein